MVKGYYSVSSPNGIAYIKGPDGKLATKTYKPVSVATPKETQETTKIAYWGDDNDFPQKWEEEIEKNTTLQGALERRIDETYAGGIEFGMEVNKTWVPYEGSHAAEIEAFLEDLRTMFWFEQSIRDYWIHRLPATMILIDRASDYARLSAQQGGNIRWQLRNPKNGLIEYAYLSRYWADGDNETSPNTISLPVINPLFHSVEYIRAEKSGAYIFQTPIASSKAYYPNNPAYSAKLQGWLDVSNSVVTWKKHLLKKLTSKQYTFYVLQEYFEKKYGIKIGVTTDEEVNKALAQELEHINEMIAGEENAGGNIITLQWYEETANGGKEKVRAWEIEELKGNSFSGEFNEDMSEADTHIAWAVGMDITTMGSKQSSGYTAGSGSDKKSSFNSRMSVGVRVATSILAPLYWVKAYNGWDPKVKFRIRIPYIADQNAITPSKRDNQPTNQP